MADQTTNGILEEFRIDFLDFWRRLPNKGFFLVLLAVWLAIFHFLGNSTLGYVRTPSLLTWMYSSYTSGGGSILDSDGGYGVLIPFVVAALFWWKRRKLSALALKEWWPGVWLVGLGMVLHILGYLVQQPRVSIVGLFAGLYGIMGVAWGKAWLRESFFPFFLFAFCVPLGSLADPITFRLRLLVCQLVEAISHYVLAIDVVRSGTQLMDPTNKYHYEVAAACSGIRSLVATFVIATVYAFVSFKAGWKKAVVIASAIPLAVLGNLLRMLIIVIAAEIAGQDAGNYVHESSFFSLIPYVPAIFGVIGLGYLLGECGREPSVPRGPDPTPSAVTSIAAAGAARSSARTE